VFLDFRFVIIKKGEIVEASFMRMNQAILMMPKAQVIDSRLIQSIKNPIQDSRFKRRNQEATSQAFI